MKAEHRDRLERVYAHQMAELETEASAQTIARLLTLGLVGGVHAAQVLTPSALWQSSRNHRDSGSH